MSKKSKDISRQELCKQVVELRGIVFSLLNVVREVEPTLDRFTHKELIEDISYEIMDANKIIDETTWNVSKEDYYGDWPEAWD